MEEEREKKLKKDQFNEETRKMVKKGKEALVASRIYEAHHDLMRDLYKYNAPTGNVFEFAALSILKYQKKLKREDLQKLKQKLEKKDRKKLVDKIFQMKDIEIAKGKKGKSFVTYQAKNYDIT